MTASVLFLEAQYVSEFGQNRIQYKAFDWIYYSTNHFDIYYYDGGNEYADQAIGFLEDEFNNITDLLGYAPYSKTKIFIYNSIHDLQQSNVGIDGAAFNIGGQTDFIKLQIEIAHPGTAIEFKQELVYKLSRKLIEEMLFGGSLAEIFQSSYLLNLPRWFVDGAARYLAYGWSSDMDDYIRNYLTNKEVKKLIKVDGELAGLVGQAVWNYIAINYGKSNVSNILNLTRIIRNEENSIASTLGMTYKQFNLQWQQYYLNIQNEIQNDYIGPGIEEVVVSANNASLKYKNVRLNSTATKIAYSQNDLGRYKIFVYDLETKENVKIQTGGIRAKGQKVDYNMPLLDWVDDETLGMIYFKRGFLYLSTYNLSTKESVDKPLTRFNKVKAFSFNENGRLAVLSGDIDGNSDIYLISMRRNAIRRITDDIYDDEDPIFVPGTASIIFSSNRPADTLNITDVEIEELDNNFNLYLYDLDTTANTYYRITNTLSRDVRPAAQSPYEVYYLSDQRGITNLFKYSFIDSTYQQITNFDRAVKDYDLNFAFGKILFLMLDNGRDKVYLDQSFDIEQSIFSPQTARQRFIQAQYVADLYNERQIQKVQKREQEPSETPVIDVVDAISNISITPNEEDSLKAIDPGIDPNRFSFESTTETPSEEVIDTDNYRFSEVTDVAKYRPESFFTNYNRLEVTSEVIGPINYEPRFSFSNLTTSFAIDQIRGFGAVLETNITDVLGNYNLSGGGLIMTDFSDGDLFAEFNYLKYRIDFKLRIDGKRYYFENNNENILRQSYQLNRIEAGAALPLTNWLRVEFNPHFTHTSFNNLQFTAVINRGIEDFASDRSVTFAGFTARSVFDNTLERGYNITQGTKGLIEFTVNQGISDLNESFSRLRVDLRHYQPVHRELTFATRLFYGESFGTNKQNFLIGGVPNWLLSQTFQHPTGDPLFVANDVNNSGVLFSEFVTNMRGFDFNQRFGHSTFLFNAELRLPVFQYLARAPVSSTFLRNFSLISFFDFGSAWTGPIPLTRETSSNIIKYPATESSIFSAQISNFKNPWLASYGLGLRTVLLGYYVKLDYVIPVEEFISQDRRYLLSIGLDF
ncbi:MAG: translocation protein TolB [Cyclobacteriaceae bacterium]